LGNRFALAGRSCVVHKAIEPAETFHSEIHKRFGVGRTRSVCPVKRYVFAEFFFEGFPLFVQEIAKDDPGTLSNETPDDTCSYSSGAACNDRHLIFESEAGCRG
jgi:hypothetical protein